MGLTKTIICIYWLFSGESPIRRYRFLSSSLGENIVGNHVVQIKIKRSDVNLSGVFRSYCAILGSQLLADESFFTLCCSYSYEQCLCFGLTIYLGYCSTRIDSLPIFSLRFCCRFRYGTIALRELIGLFNFTQYTRRT